MIRNDLAAASGYPYDSPMAGEDTDLIEPADAAARAGPAPQAPVAPPRWHLTTSLTSGLSQLADLMMPPVCLGCHAHLGGLDALCPKCWSGITFIRPPLCDRLGLPMPYDTGGVMVSAAASAAPPDYARARAVAHYDGLMRDLVHNLKFNDRHDLRRLLSRWMIESGAEILRDAHVVVPVPLSRWRLFQRGYNQAALLAQDVASASNAAYAPLALVRARPTKRQVGLTRLERLKNVSGAFAVPEAQKPTIVGRNVLLIDDVITTGATVGACAKALKRAGAARVDVLALALVVELGVIAI